MIGLSTRTYAAACIAAALFLASNAAMAAPVVINDVIDVAATYQGADYGSYSSANFANRAAGGHHWGDELSDPGHPFDTTQITINRDNTSNTITFTMHTAFNGNDLGAHYADLFLDTNTPNTPDNYNYAIALGGQTEAAGVYSVGSLSTSNDIWSGQSQFVYGGYAQFKPSSPNYDPNMALAVDTRLDSGTQLSDYSVTVTQTAASDGFFDLTVAVSSLTDLSLFDDFDLFWGTGDCGNDSIWGSVATGSSPVDAPSGLAVLFAGMLAMFALKRRSDLKAQPAL